VFVLQFSNARFQTIKRSIVPVFETKEYSISVVVLFWTISSEECSMKFQSIALMIQHTLKSF